MGVAAPPPPPTSLSRATLASKHGLCDGTQNQEKYEKKTEKIRKKTWTLTGHFRVLLASGFRLRSLEVVSKGVD